VREAHTKCAEWIENDQDIKLLEYLEQNDDLLVCDVVDSNGKTLLHECTFNDSSKCLKALLGVSRDQNLTPL